MMTMTTLPGTYTPLRPTELLVTILGTPEDLMWFHLDYGRFEDADGNVTLRDGEEAITVPLKGLYRVQLVENGIPTAGHGFLRTKEQFEAKPRVRGALLRVRREIPAPPQRHRHPRSLERAKAVLIDAPILLGSGEYGIVRRLIHEPGDWEISSCLIAICAWVTA